MNLSFRRVLSVSLILFGSTTCALADDASLNNYSGGWANIGLGFADGNQFSGLGGDISLNYAPSDSRLWTLRSTVATDIFSHNPGDVALMYGLMKKNTAGYVSVSTGLALADDEQPRITTNSGIVIQQGSEKYTLGLPLELQAFITPVRYVGIGLIGFGDVNAKRSFGGVALALQFGKLT